MNGEQIKRLVFLALLTSISLIVFVIEAQIPVPIPIPGIKLGLSNIITLFMLRNYKIPETLSVITIRIIVGSIFTGQIMSLFYSFAGSILCMTAMYITNYILKNQNLWFTSIIGAVFHNIGQIIVAMLILKSFSVVYYFPVLFLSGIITGLLTGITAELIYKRIKNNSGITK